MPRAASGIGNASAVPTGLRSLDTALSTTGVETGLRQEAWRNPRFDSRNITPAALPVARSWHAKQGRQPHRRIVMYIAIGVIQSSVSQSVHVSGQHHGPRNSGKFLARDTAYYGARVSTAGEIQVEDKKKTLRSTHEETVDIECVDRQAQGQLSIYRRFADASGQCFGVTDLDGRILYGNAALFRLCGEEDYPNVQGKSFTAYHLAEDLEMLDNELLPTLMREGQWTGELSIVSRTGEATLVISHHFLVRGEGGKPCCLAALMTNMTERRRTKAALRQSEKRFVELAKTVGEIVWTASFDGSRLTHINPTAERVYGRCCEEFYADADLWLRVVHREDQSRVRESGRVLLESGHREIAYRIVRPNGEVRWLLDRARVIFDEENRPVELGGIATDITALKEAEEKLQAEDRLLKKLLDRQEGERRILAHEIHDGMLQDIVGAKINTVEIGASHSLLLSWG